MTDAVVVQARASDRQALVSIDHVVSLVARAAARTRFAELGFQDPGAEELLASLEGAALEADDVALRASLLFRRWRLTASSGTSSAVTPKASGSQ